jgi:diguanylate cyclase (GGDEF)-like protein
MVILLLVLLGVSELVFSGPLPVALRSYPLGFLFLPILLWMAFRFGSREAATALILLAGVAIDGTLRGVGPFVRGSANESLLLLQAFLGIASVTTLVFGALVGLRANVEAQLRHLSVSDGLTGLGNYRHLMAVLLGEIRRSDRTGRSFAIIFLDVDRLKSINDELGHIVGSRALCRVAEVLRHSCRAVDTAARFGGDEFAIVLPEADQGAAEQVVRRVRERLAADKERPPVSASIGIAVYPRDGATVEALVGRADQILYERKARQEVLGGMFGVEEEES